MRGPGGAAGGLAVAAGLLVVGLLLYAPTLDAFLWETDEWLAHLLAAGALGEPAAAEAVEGFTVGRIVLDSPKGWSDWGHLGLWTGLYAIVGPATVPYHLVTVLAHVACAALLWRYRRGEGAGGSGRGAGRGAPLAALVAAGAFVALPLNQQAIALPALLQYPVALALGLGAAVRFRRWARAGGGASLAGAYALFVLSCGTKELAFVLPAVMALDAWEVGRPGGAAAPRARSLAVAWVGFGVLALPFLLRPFLFGLGGEPAAMAPADASLMGDLAEFLRPAELLSRTARTLGRFYGAPFVGELAEVPYFPRAFPWQLGLWALGLAAALALRLRAGPDGPDGEGAAGARVLRGLALLLGGYLLVGWHLGPGDVERVGELYLASAGACLLLGELFAGTARTPRGGRARVALAAGLVVLLAQHTAVLNAVYARWASMVGAAADSFSGQLEGPDRRPVVIVGEGTMDRGAVDAVVLAHHARRGRPPVPVGLFNGATAVTEEPCAAADEPESGPAGGGRARWSLAGTRFLRWDGERGAFAVLDPGAVREALAWPNPDPEEQHRGELCLCGPGGEPAGGPERCTRYDGEWLPDLRPATILRRL